MVFVPDLSQPESSWSRFILPLSSSLFTVQMYRAPVRPQRSPGAPRPAERFSSPASCWGFPAARSSFNGSGHRGASPQGCPAFSPGSPAYSPGSDRVYRDRSPAGFGRGSRGFGGQMWRRGDGFRRLPFSPNFQVKFQILIQFGCLWHTDLIHVMVLRHTK